ISGHLSDKMGSELLTFIGLMIAGTALLIGGTALNAGTAVWIIIAVYALMSLGNGMFQSPNTSLIMSHVPRDKLGVAGSVNGLVRNTGMVFGVTFSSIGLYSIMSMRLGRPVLDYIPDRPDIFVFAFRATLFGLAGVSLLGAVMTGIRLINQRRKKAAAMG
ncbi:MAG: MFS transporter, partial [Oscillospiraceae bacterium]|nr:MFS transporter [Oscillospiraceae bacterium]